MAAQKAPCAVATDGRLIREFGGKVNPLLLRRSMKDLTALAVNPVAGGVFL
jgi:hypothetical protein